MTRRLTVYLCCALTLTVLLPLALLALVAAPRADYRSN